MWLYKLQCISVWSGVNFSRAALSLRGANLIRKSRPPLNFCTSNNRAHATCYHSSILGYSFCAIWCWIQFGSQQLYFHTKATDLCFLDAVVERMLRGFRAGFRKTGKDTASGSFFPSSLTRNFGSADFILAAGESGFPTARNVGQNSKSHFYCPFTFKIKKSGCEVLGFQVLFEMKLNQNMILAKSWNQFDFMKQMQKRAAALHMVGCFSLKILPKSHGFPDSRSKSAFRPLNLLHLNFLSYYC